MASRPIGFRHPAPGAIAAGCLVVALVLYVLSPLATLWSVGSGLRHGDVSAIRSALDWHDVRLGLKTDFGAGPPISLASASRLAPAQEELPGFGESFATSIVSRVVDDVVTPERMVAMLSQAATRASRGARPGNDLSMLQRVQQMAFLGPLRFEAAIRVSDDPAAEPVRVSMRIEKWQWKITRIHLPEQMLNGDGSGQGGSNRT